MLRNLYGESGIMRQILTKRYASFQYSGPSVGLYDSRIFRRSTIHRKKNKTEPNLT